MIHRKSLSGRGNFSKISYGGLPVVLLVIPRFWNIFLLPPKLSARLALCWALIVADKDDVVNKIRSATPLRKNPFKDPYTFFRDVGLELAPPKNTQDRRSYELWERHIKALYDLIQESLGSKVLVMLVIVSVDLLKGE